MLNHAIYAWVAFHLGLLWIFENYHVSIRKNFTLEAISNVRPVWYGTGQYPTHTYLHNILCKYIRCWITFLFTCKMHEHNLIFKLKFKRMLQIKILPKNSSKNKIKILNQHDLALANLVNWKITLHNSTHLYLGIEPLDCTLDWQQIIICETREQAAQWNCL